MGCVHVYAWIGGLDCHGTEPGIPLLLLGHVSEARCFPNRVFTLQREKMYKSAR